MNILNKKRKHPDARAESNDSPAGNGSQPETNGSQPETNGSRPEAHAFDQFGLHPELNRAIAGLGFEKPTPIQTAAIPPALEGHDILACAMTGSGKTAAFALPILQRFHG